MMLHSQRGYPAGREPSNPGAPEAKQAHVSHNRCSVNTAERWIKECRVAPLTQHTVSCSPRQ